MNFRELLSFGSKTDSSLSYPRLLPSDIRYNLDYRDGLMTPDDAVRLARAGFVDEALYLAAKGLEQSDVELTLDLLERITRAELADTDPVPAIAQAAHMLEPESTIRGSKLGNLNRHGFGLHQSRYRHIARELAHNEEGPITPVLIANAALFGLRAFIREYRESGSPLVILNPHWISAGEEIVGGQIDFNGEISATIPIGDHFDRPTRFCVVDDIVRTQSIARDVMDFLNGSTDQSVDMNRVWTVIDLTQTGAFPRF